MASMSARNVDISPCPRTSGFGVGVNIAKLWKRSTREKNELGLRPRDLHEAVLFTLEGLPIESRLPSTLGGICSEEALRFSRRWSGEDVPGISSMLGERWRSQASAICMGVACSDAATALSSDDCSGVKPPSGKNGTYAMPCPARLSMNASSLR